MTLDRRRLLAAGGALAFPAQAWAAPGRRAINAMLPEEPATLCYPLFNTRLNQEICGNINESLLLFDWQFKPQPNLARAFTVSPDGLTYTFRLRSDVTWHDGTPFTARDVAFSCGDMLPATNPRSRSAFSRIDRIDTPDAHTVIFHLKEPFNAFLLALMASSAPMMPAHIYKGTDFRANPFNRKPIGTGPFKFAEWKPGQYIHLVRNPHYWRPGQPGMDAIWFRLCPTPEQRMVAIETGAVDLAMGDDIDTVVLSRLRANPMLAHTTDAYNGTGEITVMELNQRRWPFSDRRFRAAFLHAVDRDFLVRGINFGTGKVATGPIPSTAPYYDAKALTLYPYNPDRARALLDEMGLKAKRGGVRHRFGLMMNPDGGGAWTRGNQYIKQALAQVGLEAELQSADWPTFLHRAGNWEFDCDMNSYGEYGDPAIGTARFFVSSNIRKGVPQTNLQGYRNAEVDRLFAAGAAATSKGETQACYSRLQQILTHDVAMLWMYERYPVLFHNKRLKNVVTGPNGPCDGFGAVTLA